jgi:prepilin-type processing-associated H-X9-DG protein
MALPGATKGTAPGLGLGGAGFQDLRSQGFEFNVRDSAVRVPSEMLAIGDAYSGGMNAANGKWDVHETYGDIMREGLSFNWGSPTSGGVRATGWKRHQKRLNMSFCDGHVEALKPESLFLSKEDRDLRRWNIDNQPHRERLWQSPGGSQGQ